MGVRLYTLILYVVRGYKIMIGEITSFGVNLVTMPARLAFKGIKATLELPADFSQFLEEVREASDEVAKEIQQMMLDVDQEMSAKAEALTPAQKQQAAELALDSAEKHMGMAVVNMFRAIWLATSANQTLPAPTVKDVIEHK
jgi:hypothetical protein